MSSLPHVLCVDDEESVLRGLQRVLRGRAQVSTAGSADDAIRHLAGDDTVEVVVSDMRMPGTDGATLLHHVRQQYPDVTRMLLTGQADLDAAIAAVNQGGIFRFLTKPCPTEVLHSAIGEAAELHRLRKSEKELTQGTLRGVVSVLTEVLGLVNPVAFATSQRVTKLAAAMAEVLEIEHAWAVEIAASLAPLGTVTIPPDVLERSQAGHRLSDDEAEALANHPITGQRLLSGIPRLGDAAEMIGGQRGRDWTIAPPGPATLGAGILHVAVDVDRLLVRGEDFATAKRVLRATPGRYLPAALDALEKIESPVTTEVVSEITVMELIEGMVIDEDIYDTSERLLIRQGHRVSAALIERVHRHHELRGVREPFRVRRSVVV